MAARKKTAPPGHGGYRPGAGRKRRVEGARSDHAVMLKFTELEAAALESLRPGNVQLGPWLRDLVMARLFRPCPKCGQCVYLADATDIYGSHKCV